MHAIGACLFVTSSKIQISNRNYVLHIHFRGMAAWFSTPLLPRGEKVGMRVALMGMKHLSPCPSPEGAHIGRTPYVPTKPRPRGEGFYICMSFA
jgi:hypothetical protein